MKFETIDGYVNSFPEMQQDGLRRIRQAVREAIPEAEEMISYQLPTFKYQDGFY